MGECLGVKARFGLARQVTCVRTLWGVGLSSLRALPRLTPQAGFFWGEVIRLFDLVGGLALKPFLTIVFYFET